MEQLTQDSGSENSAMWSKRHKYNAKRVMREGIQFDSMMEADRYRELQMLERAGQISSLRPHPVYELFSNGVLVCSYKGDAYYLENGKPVCEDTKGVSTPIFRLKAKLFRANYPTVELRIHKRK